MFLHTPGDLMLEPMGSMKHRVGVISDTHGLLRPEALKALQGSERLIHAGDVGSAQIIEQLSAIAPVTVVRGNNDKGAWAEKLPQSDVLEIAGASIYVLHEVGMLEIEPAAAGLSVVVSGHSHKPSMERRAGILYVNPGSAGPRRFKLPVTVAQILIDDGKISARILDLTVIHRDNR